MARHRAQAQHAIAADVGSSRNEVEIDEMPRRGETKLHQRDEALAAGQKLGLVAQLAEHRYCFGIRFGPVIFERSRIHPAPTTAFLCGGLAYRRTVRAHKVRSVSDSIDSGIVGFAVSS